MAHDILVVDDNPDVREVLSIILGTLEIPIRQATNGADALGSIAEDPPSVIVLDLSMPHVDGRAVLRALRNDPDTAQIPVIVFTAEDVTSEKAEELQIPLSMMIQKGTTSMTRLRECVIQNLGEELEIDLSYL